MKDLIDKKPGYFIEKFIGVTTGAIIFFVAFINWNDNSSFCKDKYYDIIVKASSTLFGFLLTILALIINGASSSNIIAEIRKYNAFTRLIKYHKTAVFLSFIIMLFSIILYWIVAPENGIENFINKYGELTFKIAACLHLALSVWCAINTLVFVNIFYKIILSNSK
jgi:hypothetical protein